MTRHVLVIGGGENAEHDVSVRTAAAIEGALRSRGFEVSGITIGRDGRWWWREERERPLLGENGAVSETIDASAAESVVASVAESVTAALPLLAQADVIFPAIHGPLGEDGTLAALCALIHKPMVGSGLHAGATGMDKWVTKLVAEAVGIRTAPGRLVHTTELGQIAFEADVVVKPVSAGSSYGVALARDAGELAAALCTAARYDDRILVEPVVRGREIDVAVLREADGSCWAAPPLEIHAEGLFDTAAKYDGTARFTVPAALSDMERAALSDAAVRMFDALGCSGVARLDFFLTDDGPVLNEVNTMPGMTAESQVPRMFAAAGVTYEELVARLIDGATVPSARWSELERERKRRAQELLAAATPRIGG